VELDDNTLPDDILRPSSGELGPLNLETMWHGRPCTPRERVQATLKDAGAHLRLIVDATFHGDARPEAEPGSTDRLWEHEVVELFIRGGDGSYLEIEVGPFGHYLALSLRGPRDVVWQGRELRCRTAITRDLWSADLWIPRAWLPPAPHALNLCAIHGARRPAGPQGDGRRYLSLVALPGKAPDFHQPDRFMAVELP
jgi:hypothetical protein